MEELNRVTDEREEIENLARENQAEFEQATLEEFEQRQKEMEEQF